MADPRGDWDGDVHTLLAGAVIACLQRYLPGSMMFPVKVQERPDKDEQGIYRNWLVVEVPDEARIAVVVERLKEGVFVVGIREVEDGG